MCLRVPQWVISQMRGCDVVHRRRTAKLFRLRVAGAQSGLISEALLARTNPHREVGHPRQLMEPEPWAGSLSGTAGMGAGRRGSAVVLARIRARTARRCGASPLAVQELRYQSAFEKNPTRSTEV